MRCGELKVITADNRFEFVDQCLTDIIFYWVVQCEADLGEHLGPSINVETRLDQTSEFRRSAPHVISSLHHFAENNTDFSTIRLQEELIW